jgi:hypothetical protein
VTPTKGHAPSDLLRKQQYLEFCCGRLTAFKIDELKFTAKSKPDRGEDGWLGFDCHPTVSAAGYAHLCEQVKGGFIRDGFEVFLDKDESKLAGCPIQMLERVWPSAGLVPSDT